MFPSCTEYLKCLQYSLGSRKQYLVKRHSISNYSVVRVKSFFAWQRNWLLFCVGYQLYSFMSVNSKSFFRKITKSSSMNEYLCSIFPSVDFKRTSLLSYFFTCVRTYDRYQEFSLSTDYVSWTIVWKWHDLILPLHFVYSLDIVKEVSLKSE